MPRLEVHELNHEDVYKDIIRVNEAHRINKQGENIKEGQVCLVRVEGRKCLAVLRGCQHSKAPEIRMDEYTREKKLAVLCKHSYEFEFKPVGMIGEFRWAWNATEMGYQVSSRLAVLGFITGVLGLLFGIVALVK